jgi:hypothetical protein
LHSSRNGNEVVIFGFYVDDWLVIGNEEQVFQTDCLYENDGFNLKIESILKSSDVIEEKKLKKIMIFQPHSGNSLRYLFGDESLEKKIYRILRKSRFKVILPDNNLLHIH